MNRLKPILLLLLLAGAAFWGYRTFFPSDERVIRDLLNEAAEKAAVRANETGLSNYSAVQWLLKACTEDVHVAIEAPGFKSRVINGREQLGQALAGVKAVSGSISIELVDVGVTVDDDGSSATAQFIARARADTLPEELVQELRIRLKRVDGDWKFHSIEPLKTLSM